ncbi:fibrobacter succinogenes major paralogous domain-containing protein, partial [Flavobacterium sp. LS1R47]
PGAKSSTYVINSAKASNSGKYTCVVNNCKNSPVEGTAGTVIIIDETTIAKGSGLLKGESCFDIASPANNNAICGPLSVREPYKADFSKAYTYTFTNIGSGNTNLSFIVNDPEKAIDGDIVVQSGIPTSLVNGATYTVTIKYKQSLMTDVIGRDSGNPVKVALVALYKTGGIMNKTKLDITIKDCDCCSGTIDNEGNMYTTKRFGEAGCWMTQNLRALVDKKGVSLGGVYLNPAETGYAEASTAILATNTNGALDTGTIAYLENNNNMILTRQAFASKFGLLYSNEQAVNACPEGWRLPVQKDWDVLINLLGGVKAAGKKMKANNTLYGPSYLWGGYPVGDPNNSGFNALPPGHYGMTFNGKIEFVFGFYAGFIVGNSSTNIYLKYQYDVLSYKEKYRVSIRCMKN